MDASVTSAEVAERVLGLVIKTTKRKTSEDYAVLVMNAILTRLKPSHPCIRFIKVQEVRYLEFGRLLTINPDLNTIPPAEVGATINDILTMVLAGLRKTAGYFLIKEVRDNLDTDTNDTLYTMGVDLNALQVAQEIKSKEPDPLSILPSDVVRRVLKTILSATEHLVSRDFAYTTLSSQLLLAREHYPFIEAITLNNIRLTLATDEVTVAEWINEVDPTHLGAALEHLILATYTQVTNRGETGFLKDFKAQLTTEYLNKLQSYGVALAAPNSDTAEILYNVIHTVIDVLSTVTSLEYAVHAVNTFLHLPEERITILNSITIQTQQTSDGTITPLIPLLPNVSEIEARRAIHHLLETAVRSLGEKIGATFIADFQNTIDKQTLARIEDIGVNLHMLALYQQMRGHLTPPATVSNP
jgi:hypothetical protein